MARPPERPNPLDPGIADQIAERLASGESMKQICADPFMPVESQVYLYMAKDEAFRSTIAYAREAQQEFEADNCVALADGATADNWQAVKLQIWARQWRASKMAPKKYGDKIQQEVTGKDGAPFTVVVSSVLDRER